MRPRRCFSPLESSPDEPQIWHQGARRHFYVYATDLDVSQGDPHPVEQAFESKPGARTAILVLGMHRSGTSALTGFLAKLGAQAPRSLMPPLPDNPLGFWESTAFCEFHDRLLRLGGSRWNSWTSFNSTAAQDLSREWRLLLDEEFGSAPLFVLKDPRVCRLTPFWLRNLADNQIVPAAVLVVRSPLEVARSLTARDGFGMEHALLMWLRHVLETEIQTRTIKRSIVSYSHLLADWRAVAEKIGMEIGVDWLKRTPETDAEISAFLRPELRHHIVPNGPVPVALPLAEWVRRVNEALDELIRNGSHVQGALRMLDEVRREFDRACEVFGPAFEEEARKSSRWIAELQAEQKRFGAINIVLEAERNQAQALAAQLEAERSRIEERAALLEAENNQISEHVVSLASEANRREAQVVTLEQEIERLEQERERVAVELLQAIQRLEASEQHLGAALQQVQQQASAEAHAFREAETAFRAEQKRSKAELKRAQQRASAEARAFREAAAASRLKEERLRVRMVEQKALVSSMRQSRSWRMTAPLRSLSTIVKRVRDRATT